MLPRCASKITLRNVVETFEGPILLSACLQAKDDDECPFQSDGPARSKWGRVQVMMREMASITFEDLAKEAPGVQFGMPALIY